MKALGIDIGGSGIKGALVDTKRGKMITDRYRIPTPRPATPKAVITTIKKIVRHFDYQGPLGVGFPGIVVIVTCNHEVSTASVLNIFDVLFDIVTPDVAKGAKSRSDSYQKNQRRIKLKHRS